MKKELYVLTNDRIYLKRDFYTSNNDLENKVNKEIVSIYSITNLKQEEILLGILKEYYEKTKSLKASKIINDWSHFKEVFKIVVPPSEEEMLGIYN